MLGATRDVRLALGRTVGRWAILVLAMVVAVVLATPTSAAPSSPSARVAQAATSTQAVGPFCGLTGMAGLTTNTWTGAGGDGLWVTPGNWSLGRSPDNSDTSSGYVCIDAGRTVTLQAGESAYLQAVDVQSGTTLVLATGSFLLVFGDQATRPSTLRSGSVTQLKGTFGGTGRIDLEGQLSWMSATNGASTITTRRCALSEVGNTVDPPCGCPVEVGCDATASPGSTPGLLVVDDAAVLQVSALGVNLFDQYRILVRGLLALSNNAYVAADRGTSLELAPRTGAGVGTLLFESDGGWLEGRTRNGLTTLTALKNGGLIRKSGGTGNTVVEVTYTQVGAGAVQVDSGTLSLPPTVTSMARVASGGSYGFGKCAASTFGCAPVADAADPQTATVTVPGADANGSKLAVVLDASGPAGTLGRPVHVSATGLAATPNAPAVLKLRYNASLFPGRTWDQLVIQRKPDGAGAYVTVPSCLASGRPPTGSAACVDRRGLAASSRRLADGDALIVIRTTGFSRWVAR
ncbi:MAG: hypothetical protein ABI083_15325 [Lapillicoccus sp.]